MAQGTHHISLTCTRILLFTAEQFHKAMTSFFVIDNDLENVFLKSVEGLIRTTILSVLYTLFLTLTQPQEAITTSILLMRKLMSGTLLNKLWPICQQIE